ncbi:hypothetical protein ZWY2020_035530 [Hordeum vulgare]|nr:hypothetical protein ZWY2020_035530 [Hordeum vulgare]
MVAKIDRVIVAKLDKPLNLSSNKVEYEDSAESLDMGSAVSLAKHTPQASNTHALQLCALTQRVTELQLHEEEDLMETHTLFMKTVPTIIGGHRRGTRLLSRCAPPQNQPGRAQGRSGTLL